MRPTMSHTTVGHKCCMRPMWTQRFWRNILLYEPAVDSLCAFKSISS